jgi:acyl-coenzyme A thioesterase 13
MPGRVRAYQNPNLSLSVSDRVLALHNELTAPPPAGESVCFDNLPLQRATFVSASAESQSTSWSFTAAPELCNMNGNLHGGCAATLLDSLTSTALLTIAKPGFLDGGHVSRTLSCTYLRPVPMGTECVVECRVVAAGKRTANVSGEIRTKDGKVCVTCVHDKAVFEKAKL